MKLDKRQTGRWTEADVVVELCHRLKLDEIPMRCEVFVTSNVHRSKSMRCDIAIVDGEEIVCLIEVKDTPKPAVQRYHTRQRMAYGDVVLKFGIPVFYVWGMDEVEKIHMEVARTWDQFRLRPAALAEAQ